jgi:hypothetical protein
LVDGLTFSRGGLENVVVLLKALVEISVDGVGLGVEGRILGVVQNVGLSVEDVTVTCHF